MTAAELRSGPTGSVLTHADEGFAEAIAGYGPAAGSPRLLVRPADAEGVASAVRHAIAEGLRLGVRSGGHSAFTGTDGLLLDLRGLAGIEVAGDLVCIGPGALWGEVAAALAPHALALSSGDTRSVGVAGLTLGGGVGWMVRAWGLALDALVGVQLVTAAGEVLEVDADREPELFWALRGGGGNLGVVTRFDFRAHRLEGVVHGAIDLDPAGLRDALGVLADLARTAPDELTATLLATPAMGPEMPESLRVTTVWAGTDPVAARAALAPLLALDSVRAESLTVGAYADALEDPHPPEGPPMSMAEENALLTDVSSDALDALVGAHEAFAGMLFCRTLGGAASRIPAEATAWAGRDAVLLAMVAAFRPGEIPEEEFAPLRAQWRRALGDAGLVYGNFRTRTDADTVTRMYPPATLERLRAVKRKWDPANVFAGNHNVVP
ncbi:MAG: FAD-binding oxidoreductase [Actinomycetales bacterium]|nr:FAD-binding oxidoreductase [Actinomycetales bacterium]